MKLNHKLVKVINRIRDSDVDSVYRYANGGCYKFALILREIFDGDIVYDYLNGHCYFKHNNVYYDINGYKFKIEQEIQHHEMYHFPHKPHRWKL